MPDQATQTQHPLETSVAEAFSLHGTPVQCDPDSPLPLIDPGAAFLVTRGHLDIVAMTIIREQSATDLSRTHLMRISEGQVLFGLDAPRGGANVLLLGFGSAGAQLYRLPTPRLAQLGCKPQLRRQLAGLVDRWVADLCSLVASDLPPASAQNLRPGTACSLIPGQSVQPQAGVLWIEHRTGSTRLMGGENTPAVAGPVMIPLGRDAWLVAVEPSTLCGHLGHEVVGNESFWQGLDVFHTAIEAMVDVQRMRERDAAKRRLVAKSETGRSTIEAAFTDLRSTLSKDVAARRSLTSDGGLLTACQAIGQVLGIDVREPSLGERRAAVANPLERIAKTSRFRVRRVQLDRDWWTKDQGPLLGFLAEDGTPVALLSESATKYRLFNPTDGTSSRVNAATAKLLGPGAFTFYRSLPDRPLNGLDLVRFGVRGTRPDLIIVVLMGLAGGLLSLATPLAIGHVFDSVIPNSERSHLIHVAVALGVAAFAAAIFQGTRNIAMIRVENRAGPSLQAAVWDRMLNLPARFFTQFSAGDLAMRAMGIESIQSTLSATAVNAVMSSIFSLFSLGLLFYLSPTAALAALALCSIVAGVIMLCGYLQFRCQQALQDSFGKMASLLLQFMNGIAKIRVAAAEDRAFGQWAARFSNQTRLRLRSRIIGNNLSVFIASFPVLAIMVIYFLMARQLARSEQKLSTGEFLAFMSAFTTFLYSLTELGGILVSVINVAPTYERVKPILQAVPEINDSKIDPGVLRGRIEVSNVSFRYQKDDPLILDAVNLHAEPGEFIALVGPSGSGKSTLLRILLGFEQPEAGAVLFDGFDAEGLDVQSLRRQCGVVLQDGELLPGDIFTNIVGSSIDLTLDDAWEAARMAGLDADIEAMPMGMHTVISEGGGTLSGGQRQRLMVARALVTKPRLVFFDEATSALDNPTQAVVTASLDRLNSTRVVIAHRLSTIINADRIYLLEQGRVVQVGTYEELMAQPGPFAELAKRQIA